MKENTNTSVTIKTISEIIIENIKSLDSLFVFPSDVSKKSWIDWTINNHEKTHVLAFNLDKFITWDEFKSSFLRTKDENLECIPSAVRKIFAEKTIADHIKKPFLKNILPCKTEYKENAFALTDWLSGVLPSLKLLKNLCKNSSDENEIKDYIELYNRYEKFLKRYGFYEPSYLDTDFNENGKKIFIFYPEILEDYSEFKEVLEKNENVTLVKMQDNETEKPDCIFFSDTRKEIRYLALYLRKLQSQGVDLRTVAVNVPDLENIRPYLERELALYSVPFIVHAGNPYTKNCGGDIFLKIRDCVSSNFSYNSVRSLMFDRYIPWKDFDQNEKLVRKGQEMRCVCNYKGKDIWEDSLTSKTNEGKYYIDLKEAVNKFCDAKSFSEVMDAWNNFKLKFIDEEKFSKISEDRPNLTKRIIDRIITELSSLVAIEKKVFFGKF